jgi:GH25 family lysozyme M1 (1,4-beta-N-acetylmuramidase)
MDKLAAFDLWIADYRGTRPTRAHGMWQYTSSGTVPGISGGVDLSYAYKDYPAIIAKNNLGGRA